MSDSYNVIYSPQALNDLKDIYAYIAQELFVPDTARNQVNRIRKEIRSLIANGYGFLQHDQATSSSGT